MNAVNATFRLFPAALLCLGALSGAAPDRVAPQEDDPVYVDEERKDFLDKIERCRAGGDWKGLFDLQAQAAHPKKAHKLVRLPGSDPRYIGLTEHLNRTFADLPPEALYYYRGQFDGAAKREFDLARASGDRAALEHLVETWFYSSRTDEALDLLANLHVEEGRLGMAIHCWSRLLYHYPDSEIPRAVTAARLAAAAVASSQPSVLEEVRRFAQDTGLDGRVVVGETGVELQEFLQGLRVDPPAAPGAEPRRPWMSDPGGSSADVRLAAVRPEITRWSADLTGGPDPVTRRRAPTPDFPYLPAYARIGDYEMVVYTDGTQVTVIDPVRASSVRPQEAVYFSYPPAGESPAKPQAPTDFGRGGSLSWVRPYIGVTVEGELAFATLFSSKRVREAPAPGVMGMQDTLVGTTRLVCLNLRTQQVLWDTDFAEPGVQLRKLKFWDRNFSFSGPPLVRGDRVYAGIGTSPYVEEESHVVCFDRRTGLPLWEQFLASVANTRPFWERGSTAVVSRLTVLEEDRGLLVAHSNIGVVAALDAVTGHVRWLSKYTRSGSGSNPWGQQQIFARPASPLVIHDGKIYALPQDAEALLIADLATGEIQREVWKVGTMSGIGPRSWKDFQRLVGRLGDYVFLSATGTDSCILNLTSGTFFGLPSSHRNALGRGTIAGEAVYFPCADGGSPGLHIVHGMGNWGQFDKQIAVWPMAEGGNVVRAGNYLLFASSTKLILFADSEVVRAEFRRRLEQSPPNPAAWLEYGMLMRAKGNERWAEAAKGYLNFIEAVQGDPEWIGRAREVRTELHGIFLKLGAEATAKRLHSEAAGHFGRARDFAWDGPTLIEATRLLAGACESAAEVNPNESERRSWARRAVEEYQELIRRSPPGFVRPGDSMLWVPVPRFASSRIAALVKKHGDEAYEGVARLAAQELKKARKDPAALRAVADLYPDSPAAAEALDLLVNLELAGGRRLAAASLLRDLRSRLGDRWTAAHQKRIHDVLEKAGDAERLKMELDRMERHFDPAVRVGPDEKSPTVAEYLAKARESAKSLARRPAEDAPGSTATLSTWDSPAPAAGPHQLPVGWALVAPDGLEPGGWNADHEFFARGSSIELRNIRTKKKVWSAPHPGGWTGIVFADGSAAGRGVRVEAVLEDSPALQAGLQAGDEIRSVDGTAVTADDFDLATEARPAGTRLALVYQRGGETRRADLTPVAWPESSRPGIVGAVFTSEGTLAVAWEDVVAGFDVATGRVLWTRRPGRDRFVIRAIHASADRILAHEHFGGEKARSAFRRIGKARPPEPEDQHSRVLALAEPDGAPLWALGLKFDPATSAHHSVEFIGGPLDVHAGLVVTGFRGNVKTVEIVPVATETGIVRGPITLTGTGGQPSSAWTVDPATGTLWVVDSSGRGSSKLVSFPRPDYAKGAEIPLEGHLDPMSTGFGLAAMKDRVALVYLGRSALAPKLTVFSSKDNAPIATLRPGDGLLKDRVMPQYIPQQPGRRLLPGLLTFEPDGTLILYNEAKPSSAYLTALTLADGAFKVEWHALTPRLIPPALSEPEVLAVRGGPKGFYVTTPRGIPAGKTEAASTFAFINRKDGRVQKMVDDLAGRTIIHRGRIFLTRKSGLEILGD